ncbi:hypothetical protein BD779DRAFT_1676826 [Infundibulicybe gibba]|nr:hypothetical protein BD779DRAFT_1676826 [Infundibulicybe gibba]
MINFGNLRLPSPIAQADMDNHYDGDGASKALEQLACEVPLDEDRRLASIRKEQNWAQRIHVVQLRQPQTWRLVTTPGSGEAATGSNEEAASGEELVFSVSGILCGRDLPPVREKPT